MKDKIVIRGAREHNLKNIDLEIPKQKLIVFTGISGSGKSSMAFDTIYAEGQRRYVESLSSYARQFLGIMGKPDVDFIEGLSPAISIDQKSRTSNPRSTVGTITEIYDYFRLLFAKIGHPFCPNCDIEISKLSTEEIVNNILTLVERNANKSIKPSKYSIVSPIIRTRKGEFSGLFDNLKSKGYQRVLIDNKTVELDKKITLPKNTKHSINVIIDEITLSNRQTKSKSFIESLRSRIYSDVEQSTALSDGLVIIKERGSNKETLFSQKYSCRKCGLSLPEIEPRMFSFNSPLGACNTCRGLGYIQTIDPKLVINSSLSISEGAILAFKNILFHDTWFTRVFNVFIKDVGIPIDVPLSDISEEKINLLLEGNDKVYRVAGTNYYGRPTQIYEKFRGIRGELEKRYHKTQSEHSRAEIEKYMNDTKCSQCSGFRLKKEVLSIRINNLNIIEYGNLSIGKLLENIKKLSSKLSSYEQKVSELILKEIIQRLTFLNNVGLSYLSLNRYAKTLSGGESQRIRLASQIGSGLSGVIYVLDEPSIGLHPRDVHALVSSLKNLRNLGNTIIVVEHDVDTISSADYIVDFGPRAGRHGGRIVYNGTFAGLAKSKTITSKYLFNNKIHSFIRNRARENSPNQGFIKISGCRQYNLKNVDIKIPIGKLTCVSGVSGSGKSTLVVDTLYRALRYYIDGYYKGNIGKFDRLEGYEYIDKVYLVDQSPIGRTPRSNPATYIGVFDYIRDIYAQSPDGRLKGYKKGRFSFNVKGGRCEKCQGAGTIKIEMQFLPDVYVDCDVCKGKRYNSETLEVKYKNKSIIDVLNMTVGEAGEFFANIFKIYNKIKTLDDVGLSYIQLGQPAPTLSGGEAQRIKLANELSKKSTGRTFYILDEPTTGLHLYDIEKLLIALYKLVERGNTVLIIEHNLDVIKNCQYIIDLGPEGGEQGGEVLYQGNLESIKNCKISYTGKYLRKIKWKN